MELIIKENEGRMLASVSGRLDTTNAGEFEARMQPLMVGEHPDIELDCAALDYISSSGLRLFLALQKSVVKRAGKLVIKNLKPEIHDVFSMTGFSEIFDIV